MDEFAVLWHGVVVCRGHLSRYWARGRAVIWTPLDAVGIHISPISEIDRIGDEVHTVRTKTCAREESSR